MNPVKVDDFTLYKFFMDEASPEENAAVREWTMSSAENAERFRKAFDQYSAVTLALARLQELPQGAIRKNVRNGKGFRRIVVWVGGVAAALAVGFFTQRFAGERKIDSLLTKEMTISAEPGHQSSVTLPDGTEVRLSSGSSLTYPVAFGDTRNVRVEGEALFDVAKDTRHPFVVSTFSHDITVKGTTFDVVAEESKGYFSVALVEGCVALSGKDGVEVKMAPGEVAVDDGSGLRKESDTAAVENQMLWTKGVISCGGMSFDEVMSLFAKRFGVRIIIDRKQLPENNIQRMKVWESDGVESALKVLRKAGLDFTYSFDPEENAYHIK